MLQNSKLKMWLNSNTPKVIKTPNVSTQNETKLKNSKCDNYKFKMWQNPKTQMWLKSKYDQTKNKQNVISQELKM